MEFGGQHQIVPMHHFLDPGAADRLGRSGALHAADPGQLGRREIALTARELGPVAIGQHDERPGFKDPFHLLDPGREQALPFGQHRFRRTRLHHHGTSSLTERDGEKPGASVGLFWHGCPAGVADDICATGLSDRVLSDDHGWFGKGVYLTPQAAYAAFYANNQTDQHAD